MKVKVYLKNGDIKYHTFNMWERDSVVWEWLVDKYGYYNVAKFEEISK